VLTTQALVPLSVGADAAVSVAWAKLGGGAQTAASGCSPDNLFQAASASKSIAAAAVLELANSGSLLLDSPVNDALDGWSLRTIDGHDSSATIRQLLAHTAGVTVQGFGGYPASATVPSLDAILEGRPPAMNGPLRVEPTRANAFAYSGGGYCVLQRVVTDVAGCEYASAVRDTVLEPAGMRSATFMPAGSSSAMMSGRTGGMPVDGGAHTYPELAAAGMWCTPTDLVLFGLHVIRTIRRCPPRAGCHFAEMIRPHSTHYGLGLELLALPDYGTLPGHAGSNFGFKSMVAFDVQTAVAAAVMINDDRATLSDRACILSEVLHLARDQTTQLGVT
jgi:CubicO group peptidase (beta-lactamase class C family)